MRIRNRLAVVVFSVVLPSVAMADISGFSTFDPVNKYIGQDDGNGNTVSVVNTNPAIGYSFDLTSFQITDQNNGEQASGYSSVKQGVNSFTASFVYTSLPVPQSNGLTLAANGIGLIFHNESTGTATLTRIGSADDMGIGGATTSAGLLFNNFGGYYSYNGSTYFETGGNIPGPTTYSANPWTNLGSVDLSTGHPMKVDLVYTSGTLRQTITDTVTGQQTKIAATGLNIASTVGGPTAYVGFTGSTGGFNSSQSVSNFTYQANTGSPAPAAISATSSFSPIAITGFNHTIVVPASAGGNQLNYVDTTMDSGTGIDRTGNTDVGFTFFETGLSGSPGGTGLPASGSTFTSSQDGNHHFTMPAYNTDGSGKADSVVISAASPTGEIDLATPAKYSALSFLLSAGHGPVPIQVIVNYADGSHVDAGDIVANDWFFNTPYAFSAGARVDPTFASFDQNAGNVNLYQADLAMPSTASAISSLSLIFDGASDSSGVAAIFAVSGVTVNSFLQGDLNFDGNVDDSDTAAFILATVDEQAYINTYVPADLRGSFTDADFLNIADFNYDGNVDDSDTAAFILATVNGSFPPPPAAPFSAAVPEPTVGVALLGAACATLGGRRRRR